MITIYHNPRCQKSREALSLLQKSGKTFKIIKYLDERLNETTLKELISKLGIEPIDLVRKNETLWKSKYKNKVLNDEEIIKAMVEHPKLIERPIVVNGNKAVIGRPSENIKSII